MHVSVCRYGTVWFLMALLNLDVEVLHFRFQNFLHFLEGGMLICKYAGPLIRKPCDRLLNGKEVLSKVII